MADARSPGAGSQPVRNFDLAPRLKLGRESADERLVDRICLVAEKKTRSIQLRDEPQKLGDVSRRLRGRLQSFQELFLFAGGSIPDLFIVFPGTCLFSA